MKDKADPGKPSEKEETPFQRFQRSLRKIVSIPKPEIERRDAEWRKKKNKSRAKQRSSS